MTTLENLPEGVSREEWLAARQELLRKEKELTRARDRVNADRRRLPMVRVDEPYTFDGPEGPVSLLDLFEGRSQLVMHHFMFAPERDEACASCSSAADGIAGWRRLHARGTTLVAVSRAPYDKIAAYRERMGWSFPWYPTSGTDFSYDFHATLDDRVAPVLLHFRTEAELARTGTPWTGGAWRPCAGPTCPASAPSSGSRRRSSTPTPRTGVASRSSTTATRTSPHRAGAAGGVGGARRARGAARPARRRSGDACTDRYDV
jgi:predicted dithiol-disulfide oxidoreductase (DUF899 family)